MSEFSEARTSVASQIFASYFREKVDEPTLRRMVAVFEDVASFNERGIAIQFNAALAAGKPEEVIVAYESWQTRKQDFCTSCQIR